MLYDWQDLFVALALVFVIEGMLPFLRPEAWRKTMGRIATKPDQAVRLLGFISMMTGVILLYIIRR
ncbi:MAG: hypothetical protein RLZ35_353 [Pseudomonadota bacterium]|jgi:uncharacterized protein YjeT (DUF2065 family)